MKPIYRIFAFLSIFSLAFWMVRTVDKGKLLLIDLRDLGGIPWLYSAICLIFSIVAAFTIQKEWENWNEVAASIRGEIDAVRELCLWSRHLSADAREKVLNCLEGYLSIILQEWSIMRQGERSEACETVCSDLRSAIAELRERTVRFQLLHLFNELMHSRDKRFGQSLNHIPLVLKHTLIFADILLIFLSLFIGVRSPFVDYIFTVSIAVLAYTIYVVIDDLDNPFRPGSWHLTSDEYRTLFDKIRSDYRKFR